jgi:hypothetical protein
MHSDQTTRDLLLKILWCGWVAASIGGPLLGYVLYKAWPGLTGGTQRTIAISLGAIVVAAILDSASPISFRGFVPDAVMTAAGYIAFCALFVIVIRESAVWIRFVLAAAGTLSMGFVVLSVCTVWGFCMVAYPLIPVQETAVAPHLVLRITEDGGANETHDSATVELVARPWYLPGLERTQWSRTVPDDECDATDLHVAMKNREGSLLCGKTVLEPIRLN